MVIYKQSPRENLSVGGSQGVPSQPAQRWEEGLVQCGPDTKILATHGPVAAQNLGGWVPETDHRFGSYDRLCVSRQLCITSARGRPETLGSIYARRLPILGKSHCPKQLLVCLFQKNGRCV